MGYLTQKAKGIGRQAENNINPYSKVRLANSRAKLRYVPKPYAGPMTLFWAEERPVGATDSRLGWRDLARGSLEVIVVPGDHASMMTETHVQVLAEKLKDCLDAAQRSGTTQEM